jgi:hypothetical protein
MKRSNHYEAAFEAYLRHERLGCIAIDETHRTLLDEAPVKSLDFIVHGPGQARLLLDVKGRHFPGGSKGKPRRVWECWSTQDDVDGLQRWADQFGPDYLGLLVFVYHLQGAVEVAEEPWTWHGRRYVFRAIEVNDYRRHMRVRSPRWRTVDLPGAAYRALARPFAYYSQRLYPAVATAPDLFDAAEPASGWFTPT